MVSASFDNQRDLSDETAEGKKFKEKTRLRIKQQETVIVDPGIGPLPRVKSSFLEEKLFQRLESLKDRNSVASEK